MIVGPRGRARATHVRGAQRHISPFLLSADFTSLTPGAVASLPAGLSFSRASSATVQTSASTVVTAGIGTDVARVGSADGTTIGLVIEPSRQNFAPDSRNMIAASWTAGIGTTTHPLTPAGPDGSSLTSRVQCATSQYSNYRLGAQGSSRRIGSTWVRTTSGSAGQAQPYIYDGTTVAAALFSIGGTWSRVAVAQATSGSNSVSQFNPNSSQDLTANGGGAPGATDNCIDLVQIESGSWASEAIVTSGAAATRAGERLYLSSGASVVNVGRLSAYIKAQFKHSPANADSAFRVWSDHSDATTYAEISTAGVLTVSVGGVTNTTTALAWAAGDIVELWIAAGGGVATVAKYRVTSGGVPGAITTLTITGSTLGTYAPAGALDLFCDSSIAKQPGMRLQSLQFYKAGQSPAGWA